MAVIKIKSSSVAGKKPSAGDLQVSELGINLADRKLYSKDGANEVFELGGGGAGVVPDGPTADRPTDPSPGDLFFDTDLTVLLYWDGMQWVPLQFEQVQADWNESDETDAAYIKNKPLSSGPNPPPVAENGNIWIDTTACPATLWLYCDGDWNQIEGGGGGGSTIQFPVTISSTNGTNLNSVLTANGGDGQDAEGTPLSATYAWTGAKTGAGATITADVEGVYTVTATIDDGVARKEYTRTATWEISDSYQPPENKTPPVIELTGAGTANPGDLVFIDESATVSKGENPVRSGNIWLVGGAVTGITTNIYEIQADDAGKSVTLQQSFLDDRGNTITSDPSNAIGPVQLTSIELPDALRIKSDQNPEGKIGANLTVDVDPPASGGTGAYSYSYQWRVGEDLSSITSLPTAYEIKGADSGKNITLLKKAIDQTTGDESPTRESNIIVGLADVIDFSVQVVDDGGNAVGNVLTATAQGITGGVSPTKITYQWKSGGANVGVNQNYSLANSDVGKVITCDVTVSEPDDSGAVTKTGTYAQTPIPAGTIVTPSILHPVAGDNFAGGEEKVVRSDTITKVEGAGKNVYTTDTIASVGTEPAWNQSAVWSNSTEATNVTGGSISKIYNGYNEASGQPANYCKIGDGGSIKLTHTFTNVTSFSICESHTTSYTVRFNDDPSTDQVSVTPGSTVNENVAITAPTNITSVEFLASPDLFLSEIKVNGKLLVDTGITGDPGAGTLLTFPTDNNFDKFEVGDDGSVGQLVETSLMLLQLDTEPVWSATP